MEKTIGRSTRTSGRSWRRTIRGTSVLFAAAWLAAVAFAPPRGADPRPARAAESKPMLRPVAHVGGRRRGLAVDGDDVYIGQGTDVVQLRLDAFSQLTVVHRTPLPNVVASLAIAPEVGRLYAATTEGVYGLDIAAGRSPTVVASVVVPLYPDSNIVAQGDVVYAHLSLIGEGNVRCVGAVTFGGAPVRGVVGPSACAADTPESVYTHGDQLTVGDGVLAVLGAPYLNDNVPDVALFDVHQPGRPVFKRSFDVDGDVGQVLAVGKRLWLTKKWEAAPAARSFDVSNLDREPVEVARVSYPKTPGEETMVVADDKLWLMGFFDFAVRAIDPNALGEAPMPTVRWIQYRGVNQAPYGSVAITGDTVVTLDGNGLSAYPIPHDDAHIVYDPAASISGPYGLDRVMVAGGRAFGLSYGWAYPWTCRWPATLAPGDRIKLPLEENGANLGQSIVGAAQLDAQNIAVVLPERLSRVHVSLAGEATLTGAWPVSTNAGGEDAKIVAVEAAAGRAVVLRPSELHAADLARPGEPASHLEGRWRLARGLAVGTEWAAVLAGGYPRSSDPWDPPRIVLVDHRPSPPVVLGERTLADRQGWTPVGVRAVGSHLVVALTRWVAVRNSPDRHESEIVVMDAGDPAAPTVVGRLAFDGDDEILSIAAAGTDVIVGGRSLAARDENAPADWPPTSLRGRLWVVDVSAPDRPVVRDALDVPGNPAAITIDGNVVLVSAGDAGLRRFDLVGPDDRPAPVWRLALPWMAPGERPLLGQPVPLRATARPRPTTAP